MAGSVLLIVVDKREHRVLFNQALKSTTHRLIFATDGEDAFDRFSEVKPDLVLAHVDAPRIDGTILCQLIRQQPEGERMPVLLMSEEFQDVGLARRRVRAVSADGWISIPFERSNLVDTIGRFLAEGRAAAEPDFSEAPTGEHAVPPGIAPPAEVAAARIEAVDPATSTDPSIEITLDDDLAEAAVAQATHEHEHEEGELPFHPSPDSDLLLDIDEAPPREGPANEPVNVFAEGPLRPVGVGAGSEAWAQAARAAADDLFVPVPAPSAAAPAATGTDGEREELPILRAPRAPSAVYGVAADEPAAREGNMFEEQPLPARVRAPGAGPKTGTGRTPTNEALIKEIPRDATPTGGAPQVASGAGVHAAEVGPGARRGLDESRLGKRLTRRVRSIFRLLDELDYYQLLGLEAAATDVQIRDAYFELSLEFHPDRFFLLRSGDLKEKIYAIYRRVNEAYAVLSDDRRRAHYDDVLRNKSEKRAPPEHRGTSSLKSEPAPAPRVLVAGADSDRPAAGRFLREAETAHARADLNGTRLYLSLALIYDPENESIRRAIGEIAVQRPLRAF